MLGLGAAAATGAEIDTATAASARKRNLESLEFAPKCPVAASTTATEGTAEGREAPSMAAPPPASAPAPAPAPVPPAKRQNSRSSNALPAELRALFNTSAHDVPRSQVQWRGGQGEAGPLTPGGCTQGLGKMGCPLAGMTCSLTGTAGGGGGVEVVAPAAARSALTLSAPACSHPPLRLWQQRPHQLYSYSPCPPVTHAPALTHPPLRLCRPLPDRRLWRRRPQRQQQRPSLQRLPRRRWMVAAERNPDPGRSPRPLVLL